MSDIPSVGSSGAFNFDSTGVIASELEIGYYPVMTADANAFKTIMDAKVTAGEYTMSPPHNDYDDDTWTSYTIYRYTSTSTNLASTGYQSIVVEVELANGRDNASEIDLSATSNIANRIIQPGDFDTLFGTITGYLDDVEVTVIYNNNVDRRAEFAANVTQMQRDIPHFYCERSGNPWECENDDRNWAADEYEYEAWYNMYSPEDDLGRRYGISTGFEWNKDYNNGRDD
jgi:hypothetical protein